MNIFGLFAKKCEYCRNKIIKGQEIKKDVKLPGSLGVHPKNFCSIEHMEKYEQELKEYLKASKKSGGGCC